MTAELAGALAWGMVATMMAVVAAGLAVHFKRERDAKHEECRAAQLGLMQMAIERADQVTGLYERVLERKKDDTASIVETAVRMATTGTTAPPSALVQSPEPDAEQILRSRIVEETIANGMVRLREEYQRAGVAVPDDEVLREEVELMLGGSLPESATAGAVRS